MSTGTRVYIEKLSACGVVDTVSDELVLVHLDNDDWATVNIDMLEVLH